jgi:hypothetical protein
LEASRPESTDDRWNRLPDIGKPFPFTKRWVWEGGVLFVPPTEGEPDEVNHGSICVGEVGCGEFWHLIVTGPERGIMWSFSGVGALPSDPKQDFLDWYQSWLDKIATSPNAVASTARPGETTIPF